MKAKSNGQRPIAASADVELISLRKPGAMLAAYDRLNDDYLGEYVAYVDHVRGMTVKRRIVAHSKDPKVVSDAVNKLTARDRKKLMMHYVAPPTIEFADQGNGPLDR